MEIANRVGYREVLGIRFEDFFVLSDGIGLLALLDELLRSTENLLFVKSKTECHKSADSSSGRSLPLGSSRTS